ncbi:MAG: glycoside hydrolase family 25 protein [Lachnospiraceae bacterium]|nr:glycoside hydrolase family 25 protein [Lachnospiraceae bacterium]
MSMLNDDNFNDSPKMKLKFATTCVLSSLAVLIVLLVVFLSNSGNTRAKKNNAQKPQQNNSFTVSDNEESKEEYLTADDLNFWHAYEPDKVQGTALPQSGYDRDNSSRKDDRKEKPEEEKPQEEVSSNSAPDTLSRDSVPAGMFDINELSEGEAEFAYILNDVPECTYFEDYYETDEKGRKVYALNGKKTSFTGVDVSKYDKTIDWARVAGDGIDFAMIRLGSRGYQSGTITIDENYAENMKGCSENGIKIGLYFYSQAINPIEAVEEANACINSIGSYHVTYPIVFDSESVTNDTSRTDELDMSQMSDIAKAFCDTIKAYGYTPMIAATKKQFAKRFDLTAIADYDWWILDTDEKTTFPYRFKMWQYSHMGKVAGFTEPVNLDISFVDYSVR